jgi:hypothetical protein
MRGEHAPRSTGREIPALIACAVWLLGFEAAPVLHVAQHADLAPHAHGSAPAHAHGHAHEGGPHRHDAAPEPEPEHGEGSLLHRGLAAHTAPPAVPEVDPPWSVTVLPRVEAPAAPPAPDPTPPRARGPPARG